MDPRTIQFLAFCAFSVLSLIAGHTARQQGWVREETARPFHFVTIVCLWSLVSLLSVWRLPPDPTNAWLLLIQPLLVLIPAVIMVPLARWAGCGRRETGLLAMGAGMGNLGFTLGAYLCYTLLTDPAYVNDTDLPPHEAEQAAAEASLAYAVTQVSIMAAAGTLLLYPLARHFGDIDTSGESPLTLIRRSLINWRAMMLYTAVIGAVLAYLRVPFPAFISHMRLMDILFYLGAFTAYFGIGLCLHLNQIMRHLREHILLAGAKFALLPLVNLIFIGLMLLSPFPPATQLLHVLIVQAFMPTAIQLVITANLFHVDPRLASSLWLINTLTFLVLPLPVIVWILA